MSYSHRVKNIISIRDFRVGTKTYGDTEASDNQGKFTKLQNVETDKVGMVYKRDPAKYITTTDTVVSQIVKWFNTKLYNLTNFDTNPFNQNSCFISFGIHNDGGGNDDKITIYHPTDLGWEETLANLGTAGGTCKIIPFSDHVRFANWSDEDGVSRDVSIWTYNHDLGFFYGLYSEAELITDGKDGFNYGVAHLDYPDSWTHNGLTETGQGNLPNGYYYYKVVGVYDGVQEMELPEIYAYTNMDNEKGGTITLTFDMDTTDFDPRIKQLKIYRGYAVTNINVVYNHIATVEINNTITGIPETQQLDGLVGQAYSDKGLFVDPTKDFSDSKYDQGTYGQDWLDVDTFTKVQVKVWIDGEEKYFDIDSGAGAHSVNGYIKVIGVSDNDRVWFTNYEIVLEHLGDDYPFTRIEKQIDGGTGSGSLGNNILLDLNGDAGTEWKNHQFTNWQLTMDADSTVVTIIGNLGNVFLLSGSHGQNFSFALSAEGEENLAKFSAVDSNTIRMQFTDTGYPNGAQHPLDGITKTKINYKYGALHNGRMFGLYIALDPDNENEIHENWLGYSEFNQYDTMPVNNIIPLVDVRGGIGTGIISAGGYLVCFTETGVFRINVPTVDPYGWKTEQAITAMGCTAPNSILEAEGVIFFANATGIWALTLHDFQTYEITYDIKDQYLEASNLENTRITYDPKKRRLICKFGDTVATQHIFDMEAFLGKNTTHWSTQVYDQEAISAHSAPSLCVIDENQLLYGLSHWANSSVASTGFSQLYGHASGAETLQSIITTPWLSIDDIDFNIIWRKLGLVIKQLAVDGSGEDITINVYQDKFDTIDSLHGSTHTFSADEADYTSLKITEEVIRLAIRSTFLKIEIITAKTASNDFELHRLEVELSD